MYLVCSSRQLVMTLSFHAAHSLIHVNDIVSALAQNLVY